MSDVTKLILVGGFLGAGKTTMLSQLAKIMDERKILTGLVTNDQATDLVDTAILTRAGSDTKEVSGSCFCCNFHGFAGALHDLKANAGVDMIIAEPVGSCTDLSATILQPLKDKFGDQYSLAPFNVLVDPGRLTQILDGGNSGLHDSSAYIVRKQLEEADVIVINKIDLLTGEEAKALASRTAEAYPNAEIFCVSAQEGTGVEEWLDAILSREFAGRNLTDVDYDIYAEGEAVLGWLNADITLTGKADWNKFLEDYINALAGTFAEREQAIGHLKILMSDEEKESFALANLTGGSDAVRFRGEAVKGDEAHLIVNARVQTSPEELETTVFDTLKKTCGDAVEYTVERYECLMPGRPNPTYHYNKVVCSC